MQHAATCCNIDYLERNEDFYDKHVATKDHEIVAATHCNIRIFRKLESELFVDV